MVPVMLDYENINYSSVILSTCWLAVVAVEPNQTLKRVPICDTENCIYNVVYSAFKKSKSIWKSKKLVENKEIRVSTCQ